MGEYLKLQYEMRDLQQELEIRTNDNAELYAKLCNALVQIEDANKIMKKLSIWKNTYGKELVCRYIKKWGVK